MNVEKARKLLLLGVVTLAVAALAACSFSVSTAHISSLKVTKEKDGTNETNSFGPHESIFAQGEVANVPSKVTVKWRLITEKVEGQPANAAVPGMDKSFELPADGTSSYHLSPSEAGWPPGKYKIEFSMLNENGEQKDQKIAPFTVSGG
jgi:ABC-type oligopeptide transport system substrate-binding subunit